MQYTTYPSTTRKENHYKQLKSMTKPFLQWSKYKIIVNKTLKFQENAAYFGTSSWREQTYTCRKQKTPCQNATEKLRKLRIPSEAKSSNDIWLSYLCNKNNYKSLNY